MDWSRFSDQQRNVILAGDGPLSILAGPGSGKTSTLIGRTEYLIRTLGIAPQNILALTFSRKAAEEMEERLGLVLGDMGQDSYRLPKVSTFHAFCADILRQHATLVGLRADFALIDEAEGYFLLRGQANAMHLRHYQNLPYPTQYFPDMLKAISRAKDELITPEMYARLAQNMREHANGDEDIERAEKALEIAHIYQLYEQELAQRADFDMIRFVGQNRGVRDFASCPGSRRQAHQRQRRSRDLVEAKKIRRLTAMSDK